MDLHVWIDIFGHCFIFFPLWRQLKNNSSTRGRKNLFFNGHDSLQFRDGRICINVIVQPFFGTPLMSVFVYFTGCSNPCSTTYRRATGQTMGHILMSMKAVPKSWGQCLALSLLIQDQRFRKHRPFFEVFIGLSTLTSVFSTLLWSRWVSITFVLWEGKRRSGV